MEQASPYGFCMRIKFVGENCGVQIEKNETLSVTSHDRKL